ncbi:7695_t:CDS:10 [Diversispora eburnea]|uniref:Riboflavin kinase n=1 Tax=Diversispora eburnea TaxID=1213867 RepID=A0A9N8VTN7_9GLOM|nr:7695_t:CDS:10 [Diversispora eburnea]
MDMQVLEISDSEEEEEQLEADGDSVERSKVISSRDKGKSVANIPDDDNDTEEDYHPTEDDDNENSPSEGPSTREVMVTAATDVSSITSTSSSSTSKRRLKEVVEIIEVEEGEDNNEKRGNHIGPEEPISPYPIKLKGEVVQGFGRGSKELGIPTANLSEDAIKTLCVDVDTGIYFGWNPYYKNEKRSAEVHIIHKFPEDFYGAELRVIVLGYVRPEKDYSSLDINLDISVALNSLDRTSYNAYKYR